MPAAIMGIDVAKFLDRTDEMVSACMPSVAAEENPGVVLGTILGLGASRFGRDKLTIIASPGMAALGAWLEQLVSESTGKDGKGIIPIDGEALASAETYGSDRLFVYMRLRSAPDAAQDQAVEALARAGHPVVRLELDDEYDLAQEFFRWEVAVAVAGAILGINPFDQPDVEASKIATRKLTADYERTGTLPAETPFFSEGQIALFADATNAAVLDRAVGNGRSLARYPRRAPRPPDRRRLLRAARVHRDERGERARAAGHPDGRARRAARRDVPPVRPALSPLDGPGLQGRGRIRACSCRSRATTRWTVPVPGQSYTFGVVKAAQARGDFQVLAERDRRALRVHLGGDLPGALSALQAAMRAALAF